MRILALTLTLALTLVGLAPPAVAGEPKCLEVYPWSELCEGDVEGFVDAMTPICEGPVCVDPQVCALDRDCFDPLEPACPGGPPCPPDPTLAAPVECIQVIPWSYLCSGDVESFVGYFVDDAVLV